MTQSITEYTYEELEELEEFNDLEWCHYSDMPSPYFYQIKVYEKEKEKEKHNNDNRTTQ